MELKKRVTGKRWLHELHQMEREILKSIGVRLLKAPEPSLPIISDLLACDGDLLGIFIIIFGDLVAYSSDLLAIFRSCQLAG